jgi:hexosaminidase
MDCWQADPSIIADLDRGGTVRQLLERYVRAVHPQVVSRNRTAVYWEDMVLDAAVNVSVSAVPRETTVVQTWNDVPNNTKRIVQAGVPHHRLLRVLLLPRLRPRRLPRQQQHQRRPQQRLRDPGRVLVRAVQGVAARLRLRHRAYGLTADEAKLVIGGERWRCGRSRWTPRSWTAASGRGRRRWLKRSGPATVTRPAGSGTRRRPTGSSTGGTGWWALGRRIQAEPIQTLWCRTRPGMCNAVQ